MTQEEKRDNVQQEAMEETSFELTEPTKVESKPSVHVPSYDIHYAGFWMRFWAYLIDLIVIGSLKWLFIHPTFRLFDIPIDNDMFSLYWFSTGIVFFSYFIFMTKFFGQTIGKMIFGLKVISLKSDKLTWDTVLFREFIGRYISSTVNVLYLFVAFLPKKQGIHDIFSDTTVVHEKTVLLHKPAV
jgi:uncharacterized RDD family membrane protein YckC